MEKRLSLEERCRQILEDNGDIIADKARTILLEDSTLKDLRAPLEFVSRTWRDPLTPALTCLSFKAVGGKSKDNVSEVALALTLIHLSFYIWDDIIDKTRYKSFKPTLLEKYDEGVSLIIGGLASAKAFSILNQTDKRPIVTRLVWELWAKMATVETRNMALLSGSNISATVKFSKIKTEAAADLGTCLRIGAILGDASKDEERILGQYGAKLGMILELWKDFHVSLNLTSELANRIKDKKLPYSLLWAKDHSQKIREKLDLLSNKADYEPADIRDVVEYTLETGSIDNVTRMIKELATKADTELNQLKKNRAVRTLRFFIRTQPQLFETSLSKLYSG